MRFLFETANVNLDHNELLFAAFAVSDPWGPTARDDIRSGVVQFWQLQSAWDIRFNRLASTAMIHSRLF
jgi:hypothetical protein